MITTSGGAAVRFNTRGAVRGAGIGVLVLSLALTGCNGKKDRKKHRRGASTSRSRTIGGTTGRTNDRAKGRSLAGAQKAQEILPPADAMPVALRTVTVPLASRAKAPATCLELRAKCAGAVAHGYAGYGTASRGEGARFDVIVYRTPRAADRAFRAWDNYARHNKHELQVLNAPSYGIGSITYAYKTPSEKGNQETVIQQGRFIGTLKHRGDDGGTAVSDVLTGLARMYAERLSQEDSGRTPTASAAGLKVS